MKKKLKIKFWKTERALAMQIVEQEGLPQMKHNGLAQIKRNPDLFLDFVYLRGSNSILNLKLSSEYFYTNQDRDSYLDKITQAITDELFTGIGELKVGEMCEVSDYSDGYWKKKKLIAILPDNYYDRFIIQSEDDENDWFNYKYARPINKRTEPKVETNGEIITYTWEE